MPIHRLGTSSTHDAQDGGPLKDEKGRDVQSEKMLEIDFRGASPCGRAISSGSARRLGHRRRISLRVRKRSSMTNPGGSCEIKIRRASIS